MPSDPRDYKLELSSSQAGAGSPPSGPSMVGRPYLSVYFACCSIYLRIYRAADGLSYRGRCPRCGRSVAFPVGQGGTDARVFVVE